MCTAARLALLLACLWAASKGANAQPAPGRPPATTTQPTTPAAQPTSATAPVVAPPVAHCLTTATLVTLHVRDAAPKAVFEEIASQAGIEFAFQPSDLLDTRRRQAARSITLDVESQPFWIVVNEACRQAGLAYQMYSNRQTAITLSRGRFASFGNGGVLAGPCLVVPAEMSVNARVPLSAPDAAVRELSLTYFIYVEPNARLLGGRFDVREAADDTGHSVKLDPVSNPPALVALSRFQWRGLLPLEYQPARRGAKLARFTGELHLYLQSTSRFFEQPFPFTPQARREYTFGGKRFQLTAAPTPGEAGALITLYRDQLDEATWEWFRYPAFQCEMLDAAGRPLYPINSGGVQWSTGQAGFMQRFSRGRVDAPRMPGPAARFVWEFPTAVKEIVVPVDFSNWAFP